jgi:Eco57I restriction-modification methylase
MTVLPDTPRPHRNGIDGRIGRALDVDSVTKRFHGAYQKEHRAFLGFIEGLPGVGDRTWYASVMLNRLMFVYFIQKQGFLDGDPDYLKNRLKRLAQKRVSGQLPSYYRYFLRLLFHEGLTRPKAKRRAGLVTLLGDVPYLHGGIFGPHELETKHAGLDIPDEAFERLFAFFDRYQWDLDERPPANEHQINPGVIGHVFEKYVNRRQMGAYYTKEDITEYVVRDTIIPFLLEGVAARCPGAFRPDRAWRLLGDAPDRYVFDSLRHGTDLVLPREVAEGRACWNRPAPDAYGLPTETWRECVTRTGRCRDLCRKLRAGEVRSVNDLVTNNLDLRRFAVDLIDGCDDAALLWAFWKTLQEVSVLDPTCGSGAFLFAALNLLETLYHVCLDRMQALLWKSPRPETVTDFAATLGRMNGQPNRRFLVLKSIIVNNLYGVDVMKEAVEVCKSRLLLKVVAQARTAADLEPLPDVNFNLRVGNALVGSIGKEGRRIDSSEEARRLDRQQFHWGSEFADVMAGGGFDVIIGNPPYVEYARVAKEYRIRDYGTGDCGNLYAFVVERSFALLGPRGRSGMIVPHSAFCTDRMAPLMRLFGGKRATWVSTYDIRPSKLFAGVDQRLAIYLTAPAPGRLTFGTRYHRWHEPGRAYLFRTLSYADVSEIEYPNAVAKIGSATELRLWKRLSARTPLVDNLGGRAVVYYHNAPRYWVRAMTFAPYFRNERDGAKRSAQVKTLPARTAADAAAMAAALNSSLFYWWFVAFSDSRHLNRREIDRFPLGLAEMSDADRGELVGLCGRLMRDYRRHAVRKKCRYQTTGKVEYDEYYPRHSKGIIDEIDRVLARHLGLDGDELDFVLNFDLKFRWSELEGSR